VQTGRRQLRIPVRCPYKCLNDALPSLWRWCLAHLSLTLRDLPGMKSLRWEMPFCQLAIAYQNPRRESCSGAISMAKMSLTAKAPGAAPERRFPTSGSSTLAALWC